MNIGQHEKVSSHETPRYDHGNCQSFDMDDFCKPYIPFQRTCCEYHFNIDLGSRRICRPNSEINKPSHKKIPELDVSIVKNCSLAVQAVVDNDLSFLNSFLTNFPSHIDASLPYNPNYTYKLTGNNFTLLQIAIMEGYPEAVKLILQFQPDTTGKEPYPLLLACRMLYELEYSYLPAEPKYCRSEKIHDIIRHLLTHGEDPNILYYNPSSTDAPETALTYCIRTQPFTAVKMLLDHGAKPLPDVRTDNFFSYTSLIKKICSYLGKGEEKKAASDHLTLNYRQSLEPEMANIPQQIFRTFIRVDKYYLDSFFQMLINHGLDVNAYYGDLKPIHFACIHPPSLEVVNILLKHGADINARDKNGEFTALHQLLLSKSDNMSPDFVEKLLSFGADFHIKGRIPVDNSNVMPPSLRDIFKKNHPHIFREETSYTAFDLLPEKFPRDILFYEPKRKQKMVKPLNTPHNTLGKAAAADKNPSLPPETIPGATSIGHPNSGLPSQQQYPTPSYPDYASDEDICSPPFNPGMDHSHDVEDLPPPYEWLYPTTNENPTHSPMKKSCLPWKRE